jgi:hypothetical protein
MSRVCAFMLALMPAQLSPAPEGVGGASWCWWPAPDGSLVLYHRRPYDAPEPTGLVALEPPAGTARCGAQP